MPKSTFFNLPAAKRDRIVELAIEAFSERPYGQASLSKIVSRAGIAKGSIYQYFENKLDLYRWLVLDFVGSRRLQIVDGLRGETTADLFGQLEAVALGTIRFFVAEPRLARMSMRLHEPSTDPELQGLHDEVRRRHHEWMVELLAGAHRDGGLADEVDLPVAARLIASLLGAGLVDAMLGAAGLNLPEFLADGTLSQRISEADQRHLARQVTSMVRRALGVSEAARAEAAAYAAVQNYSDADLPAE